MIQSSIMHIAINALFWNRQETGSGQYLRNLVHHLTNLEPSWQITLMTPSSTPASAWAGESFTLHPVQARQGNLGKLLFEQISFPRACHQVGADVALVPYWGSPLTSPVPTVVTVHDLIPLLLREYRGGPLGRLYTSLVAASARGAQEIITDSHTSRADIVKHLRVPADKVTPILLAANERFRPGAADPAILAKYQLPDQYMLYLGSFDLRKNVPTLLHAYTYVEPALGDQYPLVLAGRPPVKYSPRFPDIPAIIQELHLVECVHLTGYVDEKDKPDLYRGAAVVAQLSSYEGFGLAPLEAMACGTPVVVSDRSSLPEVVGPAGFVVDPDNTQGVAGALIACAIQEDLASDLSAKGIVQAARFSWEQTAQETARVLEKALTKQGSILTTSHDPSRGAPS